MSEVAFLALLLSYSRMNTFHCEVFFGEWLVTIQTIFAHETAPLSRRGAGSEVNSRTQDKYDSYCQVYAVSHRGYHSGVHRVLKPMNSLG